MSDCPGESTSFESTKAEAKLRFLCYKGQCQVKDVVIPNPLVLYYFGNTQTFNGVKCIFGVQAGKDWGGGLKKGETSLFWERTFPDFEDSADLSLSSLQQDLPLCHTSEAIQEF